MKRTYTIILFFLQAWFALLSGQDLAYAKLPAAPTSPYSSVFSQTEYEEDVACTIANPLLKMRDDFRANPALLNKFREWDSAERLGGVRAWEFAFNAPAARINTGILESISTALNRTLKEMPDVVSHANVPYITNSTVEHILRGSNGGGVHHISALQANTGYKLFDRVDTGLGCYKAKVQKADGSFLTPDKDFFPDEWDEFKIIDEIKHAYENSVKVPGNNNHWLGTASNGKEILIYRGSDGRIISAFPQ